MTEFFAISHLAQLSALEVHKLYKLRVDIFVHEQKCPYAEIDDIDAALDTEHVLAWGTGKQLLGTARLYPETINGAEVLHLGRVCVLPERRGSGLANEIMKNTLQRASEWKPTADVILDSQSPLVGWYEQFGFEVAGEEYDWDGVAHTPMVKKAVQPALV